MFVSSGQFYVFIGSFAFGVLGGAARCFFGAFFPVKSAPLRAAADVFFFLLLAAAFVAFGCFYDFPSVRAYMFLAVFAGMWLCEKSCAVSVAKIAEKVYNIRKAGEKRADERKQI